MKKIAALPLNKQKDTTCPKVFGVSLLELQQQGLSKNGIPIVVWNIVEFLTQHGRPNGESLVLSRTLYVNLQREGSVFFVVQGLNKVATLTIGKEYYRMWFAAFFFLSTLKLNFFNR